VSDDQQLKIALFLSTLDDSDAAKQTVVARVSTTSTTMKNKLF